jgi:hypothetical protein
MHGGFKRPAIGLVQRRLHGGVDDSVEFIDVYIDPPPG